MSFFREKAEYVFQAGTFASGVLLCLSAILPPTREALLDSNYTLVLPGIICTFYSISHISPVDKQSKRETEGDIVKEPRQLEIEEEVDVVEEQVIERPKIFKEKRY